jgi:hypothetical protein
MRERIRVRMRKSIKGRLRMMLGVTLRHHPHLSLRWVTHLHHPTEGSRHHLQDNWFLIVKNKTER